MVLYYLDMKEKNNIKRVADNLNTDNNIYSNENGNNNNINNDLDIIDDFLLNDFVFPIEQNEENNELYVFPNFAIYYNYAPHYILSQVRSMKIKKYKMDKNTLINI